MLIFYDAVMPAAASAEADTLTITPTTAEMTWTASVDAPTNLTCRLGLRRDGVAEAGEVTT